MLLKRIAAPVFALLAAGLLAACAAPVNTASVTQAQAAPAVTAAPESAAEPAKTTAAPESAAAPASAAAQGDIGAAEATRIALAHAGVAESDAGSLRCRRDTEHGRAVYDVEFLANGLEYEYEIDAASGAVLSFDREAAHGAPDAVSAATAPADAPAATGDIGAAEAKRIALGKAPGATEADIREFERDSEHGRPVYEGELRYGGRTYEFKIDAASGEILKWEEDR